MERLNFPKYLIVNPVKKRQILFLVSDLVTLLLAGIIIFFLSNNHFNSTIIFTWLIVAVMIGYIFYLFGLYNIIGIKKTTKKLIFNWITLIFLTGFTWATLESRMSKWNGMIYAICVGFLWCLLHRYLIVSCRLPAKRIAFLGSHPLIKEIIGELNKLPDLDYRVVYNSTEEGDHAYKLLHDLLETVRGDHIDVLVVSSKEMGAEARSVLIRDNYKKLKLYDIRDFYSLLTGKVPLPIELDYVYSRLNPKSSNEGIKRSLDIVITIVVGMFFSLWALLITVMLRLESQDPILFRQEKVGHKGHTFTLLKFRSMANHADLVAGLDAVTQVNDPRITPIGYFLRLTHLDELPQLVHILKGQMSIIGPRPINKYLENTITRRIPQHYLRYLVMQGLTGWAQINTPDSRCQEGQLERLQYDLFYVMHHCLIMDIFIFLKSIKTLLTGFGAR
jgi:lipopolysaccharide/colanic/teichoic acid biosynthesis glycosyltransferase